MIQKSGSVIMNIQKKKQMMCEEKNRLKKLILSDISLENIENSLSLHFNLFIY